MTGRYNPKDNYCYTYDVLKRLCVEVDLLYSQDFKSDAVTLDKGCYENGSPAFYVKADPNKVYKFDYVPIEVRSKYDPYTVWAEQGYQLAGEDNSLLLQISYILILVALVFAIITVITYSKAKTENDEESQALRK